MGTNRTMMPIDANSRVIPHLRPTTTHKVSYAGASVKIPASGSISSKIVRVICTSGAYLDSGDSAVTADSNDMPINANATEYFYIGDDTNMAVIQQAAGGDCYVTEMEGSPS